MNEDSNGSRSHTLISRMWAGFLWAAVCLTAVAAAGEGWYLHRMMNRQAAIPSASNGWPAPTGDMTARLSAEEANLKDWSHRAMDLEKRLDRVESRLGRGRIMTEGRTERMLKPVKSSVARIDQSLTTSTSMIQSRLAQLDATERSRRMQMAHLEDQEATASKELAAVRGDVQRQLRALRHEQRQAANSKSIKRPTKDQQVYFEAMRDHTDKLEPGIELTVLSTNPEKQQYSGYVSLLEDRATIWIKNQDIQVPFVIQPKSAEAPIEVVANRITSGDVSGYLELPASDAAFAKAADVVADWTAARASGGAQR